MMKEEKVNSPKKCFAPPLFYLQLKEFIKLFPLNKETPLLIIGPTGVGKSYLLEAYIGYFQKQNPKKPVVRLNCAAINPDLLLSEIFGHVKGAFTDAIRDKMGLVEKANNGLLVLDEIGELPKPSQAELLTFIEDKQYRKVGDVKFQDAKVEIIASTNNIDGFRLDFWNRFSPFSVLPLHKRRYDILYYIAMFSPKVFKDLRSWEILPLLCYNWPGNVRELIRVVKAYELIEESDIKESDIPFVKTKDPFFDESVLKINSGYWNFILNESMTSLWQKLARGGVDVKTLDSILKEYGLSLTSKASEMVFRKLSDSSLEPSLENIPGLDIRFIKRLKDPINDLEKVVDAFQGFQLFTAFFLKQITDDSNILDIEDGLLNPGRPASLISLNTEGKSDERIFKIETQILYFLSRVKQHGDTGRNLYLSPPTPKRSPTEALAPAPQTTMDIFKKIIGGMTHGRVQQIHNEELLKRTGGNKAEAARRKGVQYDKFRRDYEKYKQP